MKCALTFFQARDKVISVASGEASKLIRGRCPERKRGDERFAKVLRWVGKPASSQCNVRLCETRYSTTKLRFGQCGQIHETLKGSHRSDLQLQIYDLAALPFPDWINGIASTEFGYHQPRMRHLERIGKICEIGWTTYPLRQRENRLPR